MMDGYAIRLADRQHGDTFTAVAQAPAGSPQQTLPTPPGSCIEIMTGAVVPTGADCVVRYEDTRRNAAGQIELLPNLQLEFGEAIHPRGSDHRAGAELLRPGRRIGSRESAIAATCGHTSLQVAKLPALTIVSTGDELVDVAAQPAPHQIRRSNDCAIETALARTQLHAARRVTLPDDRDISTEQLRHLIDSNDFLILTGGISKGAKDFIPDVLDALGLRKQVHGVAQKPGKPFGYWSRPGCGVFALPGNPLSVLVSLHRYVLPALFQSLGAEPTAPQLRQLDAEAPAHPRLTYFLPAQIQHNGRATARPANNSGDFVSILQTDGFIELPPSSCGSAASGAAVRFAPWY